MILIFINWRASIMNPHRTLQNLTALAALMCALPCFAVNVDGGSFEMGGGDEVRMVRIGVHANSERRWFQSNGTHVGAYWNASLIHWRGDAYQGVYGQRQDLNGIGLTPVFRFQSDSLTGWYAEGGIGVNLLSRLYHNNGDQLSTRFQFNDQLGFGYVFRNRWDLGVKFEHFSNGGIKKPNSGVNFALVRLALPF
jgi:lipid A 3-O-deacylase